MVLNAYLDSSCRCPSRTTFPNLESHTTTEFYTTFRRSCSTYHLHISQHQHLVYRRISRCAVPARSWAKSPANPKARSHRLRWQQINLWTAQSWLTKSSRKDQNHSMMSWLHAARRSKWSEAQAPRVMCLESTGDLWSDYLIRANYTFAAPVTW